MVVVVVVNVAAVDNVGNKFVNVKTPNCGLQTNNFKFQISLKEWGGEKWRVECVVSIISVGVRNKVQ